ncbi:MAG TPA: single-stranded-DNA-specific exonuclease RecJ [Firmicutes bacterium]|mgnify:CR=1 FL=1|nr:single-stranded-DNA-specific exonuclease RecJ [Bacillota bacterium]
MPVLKKTCLPRYQWTLRESDSSRSEKKWKSIAGKLNCSPLLARVLVSRGIETGDEAKTFLKPEPSQILPPESIPGLEIARDRLLKAASESEPVMVHGDYDADGIIGAVILHQTLKKLGCKSKIFLPSREIHGYGLAAEAVDSAVSAGIKLLVAVDCGVSSHETVKKARDCGIEVIIADHHELPEFLPDGAIIAHPEIDGEYPGGKIAGACVAFKLALALNKATGLDSDGFFEKYLPMVAVATIADVCPLTGENRPIVALGLPKIPESKIPGLRILWQGSRRDDPEAVINERDIAFGMAPILNAAGRMGDPFIAAKLLLSKTEKSAWTILRDLQAINRERRKIQAETRHRLIKLPEVAFAGPDAGILVIVDESSTPGLIGLAASGLVEETGRPTCVLSPGEDENGFLYRGSMRCAGGENLIELMSPVKKHAEKMGGHAGAMGLTVRKEKINDFIKACDSIDWKPTPKVLELDFHLDGSPSDNDEVNELDATRPWGAGNPQPAFSWGPLDIKGSRIVGKTGEHIQVTLGGPDGNLFKGIGFSLSRFFPDDGGIGRSARAAGHFIINSWQGNDSVEFQVLDIEFD